MKPKPLHFLTFGTLGLVMPASADVIYSNLRDISIPATFDGLYLNVETGAWNTNMAAPEAGWDINPFYGGRVVANSPGFQPVRSGTGNDSPVLNLSTGTTVSSGSVFSTFVQAEGGENPGGPGYGGSQMLTGLGGNFTAGQEGYLGFKLNGADYGWMRVVFTNNTGGALIKDWAYNTGGGAIATGNVLQNGSTVTLDSTFGSFTLGSQITGTNSLMKSGSGTATLNAANTFDGTTAVNQGTLAVGAAGSLNSTASIAVAAGATLRYNSSTALTVAATLNGTGTGAGQRAVLAGSGAIDVGINLDSPGDVLSPGNSPGTMSFTTGQSWDSFSYDWEINDFTGTGPGTDFDRIAITGSLTLSSPGSYQLNLLSLDALDEPGDVPDFSEISRSWNIVTTTGGITNFDASKWSINALGFTNNETGTWALAESGGSIVLSYTPIPEHRAALLGAIGMLLLLRRRR
jgi:autotransporter-associated beta strand protein